MADDAGCLELHLLALAAIDVEAVTALVNAAFSRHPIMTGDRTSPEGLAEEAGAAAEFLQLTRGSTLVGTAMIKPAATAGAEDRELWARSGQTLDDALYFGLAAVDSAETGSGVGKRLVAEAEAIARDRGYRRVILGTVREFGLVEYYSRLGYITFRQQTFAAGHWGIRVPHQYHDMVREL